MDTTLSVLFTDAVASTEALVALGDQRYGAIQNAHLASLRTAVAAHGGREVKCLGDGMMVAFTGAADALGCAVAMQQAVETARRRGEDGLALRVGIASGDVTVSADGDVHGAVVVAAARLCASAGASQILATEITRGLAGSRGGHPFSALGSIDLKGLAEPVAAVEVGWAPASEDDALVPLPPRLAAEPDWPLVGRTRELEALGALWREAAGGSRRVVLLGGEPGVGKTRLAREVAVTAHREGALVLFGRVDEGLALAYQPFAEALGRHLGHVDDTVQTRVLGLRGGVLGRLVPHLLDDPASGTIESWAMFEGLVDWLADEAARRPVVLVLDDLHWAAPPTLQALMHVIRSERLDRLLVLGTYRDTELDAAHPLTATLADLPREAGAMRIAVEGLDADGVTAFVQAAPGSGRDDREARALATRLSTQTQGNPFFVGQLLRHLAESALDAKVPEGVRDVVRRRVARLSAQTGELLQVAAVAGLEFDAAVVAEVAHHPAPAALDGFDEAVGARLLQETSTPGCLRFAHALVRQALEDELTALRRAHHHRDLALAIERRSAGDDDAAVVELARHFAAAAAIGEGERAAHYTERAAQLANAGGATDHAVALFDRALTLLPPEDDPDGRRRDRIYDQLGPCGWSVFDVTLVEDVSRRWLALAEQLDDDVMRVKAIGWLALSFFGRAAPSPQDLALFVRALRIDLSGHDLRDRPRFSSRQVWCATDGDGVRAILLASLAAIWALGVVLDTIAGDLPAPTPLGLIDEAWRLAAGSRDSEIHEEVEYIRGWVLFGSADAEAVLASTEPTSGGRSFAGGGGTVLKGFALAQLGRLEELETWTGHMLSVAERTGDRVILANARIQQGIVALAEGRFDDAGRATAAGLAARPDQLPFQVAAAWATVARLLGTGALAEARALAEELDRHPALNCGYLVGAIAAAQDDAEPARRVLAAWHDAGAPLAVRLDLPGRLWGLAECARAAGDEAAAERLYRVTAPYDGQMLLFNYSFVCASAAYVLGRLAETLGEREQALARYAGALAFEEQCGAAALAARTRAAVAALGGPRR